MVGIVGILAWTDVPASKRAIASNRWLFAAFILAWLWLPWLVYGLSLVLPPLWEHFPRLLPPVEQGEVLHNPSGAPTRVEQ